MFAIIHITNMCKWILFGVIIMLLVQSTLSAVSEESCKYLKMNRKTNQCPTDMSYKLWPLDEKCNKFNVTLAPKDIGEPRALIQFLSGTRIGVGQTVEQLTGIYMGHIHGHIKRYSDREDGEANRKCISRAPWKGRTIMIKSRIMYELFPEWLQRKLLWGLNDISLREFSNMLIGYRGIILIEDPWESLLTARARQRGMERECQTCKFRKRNLNENMDFVGKDFEMFMIKGATMWADLIKTWIRESPDKNQIVLNKENFLSNPEPDLRRILKYLNVPLDEERLECVLKYRHDVVEVSNISPEIRRMATKHVLQNQKANNILTTGMKEINDLLINRGINYELTYTLPTL